MATSLPFPAVTFLVGRTVTPDVTVPVGLTLANLDLDVAAVALAPVNEHLEVGAEMSYDGGTTWFPGGSAGINGGEQPRGGSILRLSATAQQSTNPIRRVRGFVDISDRTGAGGLIPLALGPGTLTVS